MASPPSSAARGFISSVSQKRLLRASQPAKVCASLLLSSPRVGLALLRNGRTCLRKGLSSGQTVFLLLTPAAASCSEGFGGYVELCGVLDNISPETLHLQLWWAGGIWMVSMLLGAAEVEVQFSASGGVREARFTQGGGRD